MGRTKVFVGNLSFKTTDGALASEFEAAGKVASATIISRGSRSLGYGFVEMESEEEAKKSVELLNKKLIDGREINVEIARPREEKPPVSSPSNGTAPSGDGAPRGASRGRRPFRGRGGGRFRGRGGRVNNAAGAGGDGTTAPSGESNGAPRRRGPRPPRNDVERGPRIPSNDTLFVANLPFSVDDAGLANIFQGLNIKGAHVVRKHNARSKGFGFVEFNNAEDQQKALTAVDKKNVEGRELIVKVALAETKSAPAATAGAPADSN